MFRVCKFCVGVWVCLVFCVAVAGCSDTAADVHEIASDTDSVTSGMSEECEPMEGFDSCTEILYEDMLTWQESLREHNENPPWRSVEEVSDNVIKVVLDPQEFNAGFLPVGSNQGRYESEVHFYQTLADLLGVSIDVLRGEEAEVIVVEESKTQKVVFEEDAEEGDLIPSAESFVFDALTNDEGVFHIEGEEYQVPEYQEYEYPEPDMEDGESGSDSQVMTQSGTCDFFEDNMFPVKLAAGNWEATLDGGSFSFLGVTERFTSSVEDFTRDGDSTYKECSWKWYGIFPYRACTTHRVAADEMRIEQEYAVTTHSGIVGSNPDGCIDTFGYFYGGDSATKTDADEIRISRWFSRRISQHCARARVEDSKGVDENWGARPAVWTLAWNAMYCTEGFPSEFH